MQRILIIGAATALLVSAAHAADKIRETLEKLAPETRAHQACAVKALEVMRRDPLVKRPDMVKSSIFSGAKLNGAVLEAPGAAVRTQGHWYAMSYTCSLSPDLMQALTFTYKLGTEVPKPDWERRGLW